MVVSSFKTRENQVKIFDASLTRGWTAWRRPFESWRKPWLRSVFQLQSSSTQAQLLNAALSKCQTVRSLGQINHRSHRSRPLWAQHRFRFMLYTSCAESCSNAAWAVFPLHCFSLGDFTFRLLILSLLINQNINSLEKQKKKHVEGDLWIEILPLCLWNFGCYPAVFKGIVSYWSWQQFFPANLVTFPSSPTLTGNKNNVRQKRFQTRWCISCKGIFLCYGASNPHHDSSK